MGKTTIKFSLDTSEVNRAIREIKKYEEDFLHKWRSLMNRLVDEGAEIAKTKVRQMDAVMFGDLLGSIEGVYHPATGIGLIIAGSPHAVYVEYGSGVIGSRNPHPEPISGYDRNNWGDAGWWYWGDWDSNWHWTAGMGSRPFMWETSKELPALFEKLAREEFR